MHVGFKKLEAKLDKNPKIHNPGAVAASIGNEKYGKKRMQKAAKTHHSLAGIDAAMNKR